MVTFENKFMGLCAFVLLAALATGAGAQSNPLGGSQSLGGSNSLDQQGQTQTQPTQPQFQTEANPNDLINEGADLAAAGRYVEAHRVLTEAAVIFDRRNDDAGMALALSWSAYVSELEGDPRSVVRTSVRASEAINRVANPDLGLSAVIHGRLGAAYADLGRYQDSLPQFERAIEDSFRGQGADHEDTVLWNVHYSASLSELAYFYRARDVTTRTLGVINSQSQVSAGTEFSLWLHHGYNLTRTGQPVEGADALRRALGLANFATIAPNQRISAWENLAEAFALSGQGDAAARELANGLRLFEEEFGPESNANAEYMILVAQTYGRVGKVDEARALAQRILERAQQYPDVYGFAREEAQAILSFDPSRQ